uniref:Uncharacterized protein n=1 Tax=Meloidogyne incognita TaxID=6306 RepID=A0A914NT85_MELIC
MVKIKYIFNQNLETEIVDPVYLALKQATCRYGSNGSPLDVNGGGSKTGSRRGSQSALAIANNNINNGSTQLLFESCTPSPRNLSQTSLQDSGYAGGGGNGLLGCGYRSLLVSGSTPQLHALSCRSQLINFSVIAPFGCPHTYFNTF